MWNGAAILCLVTGTRTGEQSTKVVIYGCLLSLLSQDIVVWSITMDSTNVILYKTLGKHLFGQGAFRSPHFGTS